MVDRRDTNQHERARKLLVKESYKAWIAEFGMTHTLTFNFANQVGPKEARYKMKGFCGRIERAALGRYYYRRNEPRLGVVGFPEHMDSNPHWHCVVRAEGMLYHAIEVCSGPIWEKIAPGANIDFAHPRCIPAIQKYFLKDFLKDEASEEVFEYAADRNKPYRRPHMEVVK